MEGGGKMEPYPSLKVGDSFIGYKKGEESC
jgi:hypothetical protein